MPTKNVRSTLKQTVIRQDKAVRADLRAEMRATSRDMANWLTIAVRGWKKKKPRFVGRVEIRPDRLRAFVDVAGTAKKIFVYIDQGTGRYGPKKRPYVIEPKQPNKLLKFQKGYSPKTAPVARINVGTGQRSGGWVSKVRVIHPGIKARKFTETVSENLKPSFDQRIDRAIRRGISKVR